MFCLTMKDNHLEGKNAVTPFLTGQLTFTLGRRR